MVLFRKVQDITRKKKMCIYIKKNVRRIHEDLTRFIFLRNTQIFLCLIHCTLHNGKPDAAV